MKKLVFLLTALSACIWMAGPVIAGEGIQSWSTTNIISGESGTSTAITRYYGKNGLVDSMSYAGDGEEAASEFQYSFDEKGNPAEAAFDMGEDGDIRIVLTNHYENGELQEVEISDIIQEGESLAETYAEGTAAPEDIPVSVSFMIQTCMNLFQYYTGYQNVRMYCSCPDIGNGVVFEDGEIVYSSNVVSDMRIETRMIRAEDGSVTNSNITSQWNGSDWEIQSEYTTAKNVDGYYCYVSSPDDEAVERQSAVTYQESTDPESGKTLMTGYLEADPSEPFVIYTLSDSGKIEKEELLMENSPVNYYDETGQLIRSEQNVNDTITITNEWVYYSQEGTSQEGHPSADAKGSGQEQLIRDYLAAVHDKDYETIWDMIPEQFQDYAMEQGIVTDREDAIDFVYFGVNDYYWLRELDLPSHKEYTFEVLERHDVDKNDEEALRMQKSLSDQGLRVVIEGISSWWVKITADQDTTVEATFFMIKTRDQWYLTSVVGDDELVKY